MTCKYTVFVVFDTETVFGVFTDVDVANEQCEKVRDAKSMEGCQDTRVWCVPRALDKNVVL